MKLKSRKLANAIFLNLVLVVLIFWTQIIVTYKPEQASGFQAMQIAWVGSFLMNNGFYFLANVGQKVLLKKFDREFDSSGGEKDDVQN